MKVAKLYFQNKEEMKQNTPGLSIESTMKKKSLFLDRSEGLSFPLGSLRPSDTNLLLDFPDYKKAAQECSKHEL